MACYVVRTGAELQGGSPMDTVFRLARVAITAAALFLPVALGAALVSSPAYPQGAKDDGFRLSEKQLRELNEAVRKNQIQAPPQQAPKCGPHAAMKEGLLKRYKESRRGLGLISPTAVMEMYFSEAGTWTVLITDISGNSCVASSGTYWIEYKPEIVGPKV